MAVTVGAEVKTGAVVSGTMAVVKVNGVDETEFPAWSTDSPSYIVQCPYLQAIEGNTMIS